MKIPRQHSPWIASPHAPGARRHRSPTAVAWLGCCGVLIGCSLLVHTVVPVAFVSPGQAVFFTPAAIAVVAALGLLGAWLADRTGFPDPLGPAIPPVRRFGIPVALGVAFGAMLLAIDLATGLSRLQAERFDLPSVFIPPPGGVIVYTVGAIVSEVIFRLLPIPLLLWLISSLLLRGRGQEPTFWALAVLTSLLEPLSQSVVTGVLAPLPWAVLLAQQVGANFAQAAVFRRYGLLASIALRLALYLVYDVIGAGLR